MGHQVNAPYRPIKVAFGAIAVCLLIGAAFFIKIPSSEAVIIAKLDELCKRERPEPVFIYGSISLNYPNKIELGYPQTKIRCNTPPIEAQSECTNYPCPEIDQYYDSPCTKIDRFTERRLRFWGAVERKNFQEALNVADSLLFAIALKYRAMLPHLPPIDDADWSEKRATSDFTAIRIPLWLALGKIDAIRYHATAISPPWFNESQHSLAEVIRTLNPMPIQERRKIIIQSLQKLSFTYAPQPYPLLVFEANEIATIQGYAINLFGFTFFGTSTAPDTTFDSQWNPANGEYDSIQVIRNSASDALDALLHAPLITDLYCRDPTLKERCSESAPHLVGCDNSSREESPP